MNIPEHFRIEIFNLNEHTCFQLVVNSYLKKSPSDTNLKRIDRTSKAQNQMLIVFLRKGVKIQLCQVM
jgi:hypothetical protein